MPSAKGGPKRYDVMRRLFTPQTIQRIIIRAFIIAFFVIAILLILSEAKIIFI